MHFKNIKKFFSLYLLFVGVNGFAQVGKYDRVAKEKKDIYNCPNVSLDRKLKRSQSIKVVYSDRNNNSSYEDAYGRKKYQKATLGDAYYVIDQKNNAYELVLADPSIIGKPQGLFSFLMSKKTHFADSKSAKYKGWISKERLLLYGRAIDDSLYHQPKCFRLGISNYCNIQKINRFIKGDSVMLYDQPNLQKLLSKKLKCNSLVYTYKYSNTKDAILISNYAEIDPENKEQVLGWVPKELLVEVGSKVYYIPNTTTAVISNCQDTIRMDSLDIDGSFCYTVRDDSLEMLRLPVYLWNHHHDKMINVKGNVFASKYMDIIRNGSKIKHIHLVVQQDDLSKLKGYMGVFQNIWMLIRKYHYSADFSFSTYGSSLTYRRNSTQSYADWINYISKAVEKRIAPNYYQSQSPTELFQDLIGKQFPNQFEDNLFIVVGSKHSTFTKKGSKWLKRLTPYSPQILFVQLENNIQNKYQDFVLGAKYTSNQMAINHSHSVQNYMVDNSLVVKKQEMVHLLTEHDNVYLYHAPEESLYNGGILFPSIGKHISPASFDMAIDSLFRYEKNTYDMLNNSLETYHKELVMGSRTPSNQLKLWENRDLVNVYAIPENNINDIIFQDYYTVGQMSKLTTTGILLREDQLTSLIDSYRSMFPRFSSISTTRKERRLLKKIYRQERKRINRSHYKRVLKRKDYISSYFFYKTSIPFYDKTYGEIKAKKIVRKKVFNQTVYEELIRKIDHLEKSFLKKEIKKNNDLFFIPNELLL